MTLGLCNRLVFETGYSKHIALSRVPSSSRLPVTSYAEGQTRFFLILDNYNHQITKFLEL